jgi:hypothetical protein
MEDRTDSSAAYLMNSASGSGNDITTGTPTDRRCPAGSQPAELAYSQSANRNIRPTGSPTTERQLSRDNLKKA